VADVGLEAAVRQARTAGHEVPAEAGRPGDPCLVRDVRERRRRVALRHEQVHGVIEQRMAVDAHRELDRLVLPLVAEHEVDVAERQRGQRLLGLGLDNPAAQPREVALEPQDRRQRDAQEHRLEPGDAAAAGDGA
jgi:hypothetical protein